MGSCASVHKVPVPGFPKKLLLASPPTVKAVGGKGGGGGAPVGGGFVVDLKGKLEGDQRQAGLGPKSSDSGSKDEMFFDSRACLDSDCEDDFYSVNGDFTPSRGSTPNYQPRIQTVMSNAFLPDNVHSSKSSEPSPTGRRKLAELLQEAMQSGFEGNTTDAIGETDTSKNEKQLLQSVAAANGKPVSESSSTCSTDPMPTIEGKNRKEKAWYTGRCCFPSFVHSLTLDERRHKMSPGPCAV